LGSLFDLSGEKIGLILLVALLVYGPNDLPKAAAKIGEAVGQLLRMSTRFEADVRSAFEPDTQPPTFEQRPPEEPKPGAGSEDS
jgi:Sec-independent protein translocase protein TatA